MAAENSKKSVSHTHVWRVVGLDCPTCAKDLEAAIREQDWVSEVELDFMGGILRMLCNLESGCLFALEALGNEHGVKFYEMDGPRVPEPPSYWPQEIWIMAGSGAPILLSYLFERPWLLLLGMAVAALPVLKKALKELAGLRIGMNFLMVFAALGAVMLGEWSEGAMVLFLFTIARWLEKVSGEKARSSIEALKLQLPAKAHLAPKEGAETDVAATCVRVGDRIRIKPGERVPLDGIVLEGASRLDESTLTGESLPVMKEPGADVFAGTYNQEGAVVLEVSQTADSSRFSRIMLSVQKAQSIKTRLQSSIERFAEVYTPMVVAMAIGVAIFPPLIGLGAFSGWVHSALVLLVIACPCALVLAAPVTLVGAMAAAARSGILIRGGDVLESAASVKVVAFDKTGTITVGEPDILELIPIARCDAAKLLRLTAALEAGSEHPLAGAFLSRSNAGRLTLPKVGGFASEKGQGIMGVIDRVQYRFGASSWAMQVCSGWPGKLPAVSASCMSVSVLCDLEGPLGMVFMGDRLRPEAAEVIRSLKSLGVGRTILLSGDREETAREFGAAVGIDESFGRISPECKGECLKSFAMQIGPTLMLGDGVNDTPALAVADVGVAMGAKGADAALQTAGAVLLHDDLRRLPLLLAIAARSRRLIRQNIGIAVGLKLIVFGLSLAGMATLWMAVLADTGASVLVVANGLRALRSPRLAAKMKK